MTNNIYVEALWKCWLDNVGIKNYNCAASEVRIFNFTDVLDDAVIKYTFPLNL